MDSSVVVLLDAPRHNLQIEWMNLQERLPDQYDTVVGERGIRLSGGSASGSPSLVLFQRIRAFSFSIKPQVRLIRKSEAMIRTGLSPLMRGRTTFVIAHRLSYR